MFCRYEIWCSTEHGNKRLDAAWREREGKVSSFLGCFWLVLECALLNLHLFLEQCTFKYHHGWVCGYFETA